MYKLTSDQVRHVAKLAKLHLTDSEIDKFSGQLSKILDLMDDLAEVEIEGVEPTSQTTKLTNVFRKDEVRTPNCLSLEAALSGSDLTKNGYFVVDQIIKKNDLT